jgi:hypothetical protein
MTDCGRGLHRHHPACLFGRAGSIIVVFHYHRLARSPKRQPAPPGGPWGLYVWADPTACGRHLNDIAALNCNKDLFNGRQLLCATANTRKDGEDFQLWPYRVR